ncbi:hypothetical protein CONPUDRAFT_158364 [Coniophora puteana RWD-64-598 SS2]|uniref:Uncharacterized protein n=1 Tax=Coniophora puteana (strain RWD-64-598) TaxID=741705 RepID=A0A5M3MAN6_CONPW|nr:uncharacterized protein CONPUDRAFT_158364 [Coniophora puteana RWD-64-598 SS2]EIW76342.1 hypothetical protein CONPUDRAFT_158364 [Coniophora puteana RWD-64-598 SS2]
MDVCPPDLPADAMHEHPESNAKEPLEHHNTESEGVPLFKLAHNMLHYHTDNELDIDGLLWDKLRQDLAFRDASRVPLDDELDGMYVEPDYGIQMPDTLPPTQSEGVDEASPDNPSYPWPSKEHFITSVLFSSPRVPYSTAQKTAVLNWAKELGAPSVPSLYSLRQTHLRIKEMVGDPTERKTTPAGDVLYINSVARAIAMDYSNPLTRHAMQDYPEDGPESISEVFHGLKMLVERPSPPAVRWNKSVYFVDELLQLKSGNYFIPSRYFYGSPESSEGVRERKLLALGLPVRYTAAGFDVSSEPEIVPISSFAFSLPELEKQGKTVCGIEASSRSRAKLEKHPSRIKYKGKMVHPVPLIVFMDDVSGNISKQWNKHHAVYMSNANLPRRMVEKEFCIRFVSSSPNAAPMELMRAMKESVSEAAASGVRAWDCKYEEEVILEPYGLFFAGDNPMQAEECSQGGVNCNHFCRTCDAGGPGVFKESSEGYNSIFTPGNERKPEETREHIVEQFKLAVEPGAASKLSKVLQKTGVRDTATSSILNTIAELGRKLRAKTNTPGAPRSERDIRKKLEDELEELLRGWTVEDAINPLLGMDGVNIHMDTPTEILHTILLGVVKYMWGQTVFILDNKKLLGAFQTRLDSVSTDGLNVAGVDAEYMIRHRRSLIGKHFKSLAQVMPFLIYDLVPSDVLDAWTRLGELVVLIWHTEIHDMETYLADLTRSIHDFLNITCKCAPSIIISKGKYHFLVHLPAYIRRFGPAIIFSTERYESFNHVFRLSCIFSNRQAPSRDSCTAFALQDVVKHLATGGFFYDKPRKQWIQAGQFVRTYLKDHPEQARLLGLTDWNLEPRGPKLGSGKPKRPVSIIVSHKTRCSTISSALSETVMAFCQGESLITQQGDNVAVGQHVIVHEGDGLTIGTIREILISADDENSVRHVAIQLMTFEEGLQPLLHVPRLRQIDREVVVSPMDIVCAVNLQHNCADSVCNGITSRTIYQEREATERSKLVIQHEANGLYIKEVIPPSLRDTPLRVRDVERVRAEAVAKLKSKNKKSRRTNQPPDDDTRTERGQSATPSVAMLSPRPPSVHPFELTAPRPLPKPKPRQKKAHACQPTVQQSNMSSSLLNAEVPHTSGSASFPPTSAPQPMFADWQSQLRAPHDSFVVPGRSSSQFHYLSQPLTNQPMGPPLQSVNMMSPTFDFASPTLSASHSAAQPWTHHGYQDVHPPPTQGHQFNQALGSYLPPPSWPHVAAPQPRAPPSLPPQPAFLPPRFSPPRFQQQQLAVQPPYDLTRPFQPPQFPWQQQQQPQPVLAHSQRQPQHPFPSPSQPSSQHPSGQSHSHAASTHSLAQPYHF